MVSSTREEGTRSKEIEPVITGLLSEKWLVTSSWLRRQAPTSSGCPRYEAGSPRPGGRGRRGDDEARLVDREEARCHLDDRNQGGQDRRLQVDSPGWTEVPSQG